MSKNLFDMMGEAPNSGADPMTQLHDAVTAHRSRTALAQTSQLANRAVSPQTPAAASAMPNTSGFTPEIIMALRAAAQRQMQREMQQRAAMQQPQPGMMPQPTGPATPGPQPNDTTPAMMPGMGGGFLPMWPPRGNF